MSVIAIINAHFHIDENYRIIKSSNGEAIPQDEPICLLRGRDKLVIPLLEIYRILCVLANCNDWFMSRCDEMLMEFKRFAKNNPDRMKLPGITKGK